MKVKFSSSGGFAGLLRGIEIDTASLGKSEAAELERLVRESGLGESRQDTSTEARDLREYTIVVENDGREVSLTFDDQSITPSLRPLLAYLKRLARPIKP